MIPVNQPIFTGREKELLCQCIEEGWVSSEGPFVAEFEQKFADFVGVKYGVSVCNGTVAIETALSALEISSGDEIILPTFTIISCVLAVLRRGGIPVLVDVEPETWCMDVNMVESKITRRTKAVMPVHIYGHPVDMDPLLWLSEKYGVKVVEDAAEVHGAKYKGKKCGSIGDISCFSFYPNKIITTGEGGMVLTNDARLATRARSIRNLCFVPEQRFLHYELGNNFRFTTLQAALGLAQLEKIEEHLSKKRWMGREYTKRLRNLSGLAIQKIEEWAEPVYWVYGVVLDDDLPIDAKGFAKDLADLGVQTRPFFWPLHEQPVLKQMGLFKGESYPVAEKIARRGLYLPSGLGISQTQIEEVCSAVETVLAKY